MDEYMRHVSELNTEKSRFTVENVELARQLDEAESSVMQLQKMKSALTRLGPHELTASDVYLVMSEATASSGIWYFRKKSKYFNLCLKFPTRVRLLILSIFLYRNLEEMTASQEEEARVRAKLAGEMRNMSNDIDHLREQLEEEQKARAELQRSLTKANNEVLAWKQKYESGEGNVRYVAWGKIT